MESNRNVASMRWLWNLLSLKSRFGFISHLERGHRWDPAEFHLTGVRFVDRMMERFDEYGRVEASTAHLLEIGCGVGRFLRPLACRFKHVTGVDISRVMLSRARRYCAGLPNITTVLNDGASIPVADNSVDYCVSAGVFQHITDAEVVLNYIREALRVLAPGGLFLFQFEGNRTAAVGHNQTGARISAALLDAGLAEVDYRIREISLDPKDAIRCVVIVLEKPVAGAEVSPAERSFSRWPMSERRWLSGVYDDVKTRTQMHARQAQTPMKLTFYED
ncbi:MAG: class I SAM-dependent methyltransferase [Proteobacteria bacterium]|nr:class I SAM-dependent methyltransferase [Pseudomonadota bacterium]